MPLSYEEEIEIRREAVLELSSKGLTQQQIAQKLGYSQAQISKDLTALKSRAREQLTNHYLELPISSFVHKFKNDLFTTTELAEFEKNNIAISDIHKRPLNKNIAIAKATNLGLTELMIRAMLYKTTVNDDLRGSTMCILVGPNFQLALGIMDRIRQLLGRN
jgi:DNA-binding CsgD family transcriptional regulator